MAINPKDDYESLAKLLYPSIEASGNVYYGQTRKLTIDEVFDKNGKGFHSRIESKKNDDSSYSTYFCWELGPLKGVIKVPEVLPCIPMCFAKYELNIKSDIVNQHLLFSGKYNTYEREVSALFKSVIITNGKKPSSNEDWDGANFYVIKEGISWYIYIALKGREYNEYTYSSPAYEEGDEFCIRVLSIDSSASTHYIRLTRGGAASTHSYFYYKINNSQSWTPFEYSASTTSANNITDCRIGDCIYIKVELPQGTSGGIHTTSSYNTLDIRGYTISVSGDFRSLQEDKNRVKDYEFYRFLYLTPVVDASDCTMPSNNVGFYAYGELFYGSTLVNGPKILPASTIGSHCYNSMFSYCNSLLKTPSLPATNLSSSCYTNMFEGCTSLKIAPYLPAINVPAYSYSGMFHGCTSLEKCKGIAAINVEDSCIENMFSDCDTLEISPELYCSSLGSSYVFTNCASLNKVYCYANTLGYTTAWLYNVSSTGDFYCNPNTEWPTGGDGIPAGWNRHNICEEYVDATTDFEKYNKREFLVTSGTNSIHNGRGDITDNSTLNNIEKSFDENGTHQMNTYNLDGSLNQEVWGYKSFNSPVEFNNGVYFCDNCFISSSSNTLLDDDDQSMIPFIASDFGSVLSKKADDTTVSNAKVRVTSIPSIDFDDGKASLDDVSLLAGKRSTIYVPLVDIEKWPGNGSAVRCNYINSIEGDVYENANILLDTCCKYGSTNSNRAYISLEASNDYSGAIELFTRKVVTNDSYYTSRMGLYDKTIKMSVEGYPLGESSITVHYNELYDHEHPEYTIDLSAEKINILGTTNVDGTISVDGALYVNAPSYLNDDASINGNISVNGSVKISADQPQDNGFFKSTREGVYDDTYVKLYVDKLCQWEWGSYYMPAYREDINMSIDCFQYGSTAYGEPSLYGTNSFIAISGSYVDPLHNNSKKFFGIYLSNSNGSISYDFSGELLNLGTDKLLCCAKDFWNPLVITSAYYNTGAAWLSVSSSNELRCILGAISASSTFESHCFKTIHFFIPDSDYEDLCIISDTNIKVRQLQYFNTFMFSVLHNNTYILYIGKFYNTAIYASGDYSNYGNTIKVAVEYMCNPEDADAPFSSSEIQTLLDHDTVYIDRDLLYVPMNPDYNRKGALYKINAIEDKIKYYVNNNYPFKYTERTLTKLYDSNITQDASILSHISNFDYNKFMYLTSIEYKKSNGYTWYMYSLCIKSGWYVESKGMAIRPLEDYMPSII